MNDHESDNERNREKVKGPYEIQRPTAGRGCGQCMDGADGESLTGVGMAFAASLADVCLIHSGARVAGREDVVHAVATGAIGNGLLAGVRSQAMVTLKISGDARARHVES